MYAAELFPTEVRTTVVGAASTFGSIGGMIAGYVGGPLVSILPS